MSALSDVLAKARTDDRAALIGYLPVGYPDVDTSITAMVALVEGGCDVVEVGIPYSDPVMDGPTIQAATEPAVQAGVGIADALQAVRAVTSAGAAAVTMGYWNQVERYGVERFATDLAAAGGSGAVTPDLIPDEAAAWIAATDAAGLDRIFLVAPSSTDARIVSTTQASRGFVYASAVMGVTGARASVGDAAATLVDRVRRLNPDVPVCVGLGVSTGEQAAEVAAFADGVIVGSALVRCLLDSPDEHGVTAVRTLSRQLADGVRARAGRAAPA
ncbi:tryptophan synthase subunit alpha [Jatrophihabitans endophyticus]|uniref:tryptophan synthase subunit alpha n=1 Tax=Jatrophihabitans endophyticus TaxID=1206085 RepID=UPI001A0090A4|nr:tryptophan synthase subunit alpha [Jatrophihabitans endophyticus]MBE7187395.1 tryptophan synthase subunit alpha [Jatrophihabitans endophyticus]